MVRQALRWILLASALSIASACGGEHHGAGEAKGPAVPAAVVDARETTQASAARALGGDDAKQILFGDLHVHTTFSPDAFVMSLPVMGGEGVRPPAAACDFARYCSALDFWSINDHAEGVTPRRWRETIESIQQCNAIAGDPTDPDMVAFAGWEWSQVALTPEEHWGHKNVIFLDTDAEDLPRRAIAAPREQLGRSPVPRRAQLVLAALDWGNREFYLDFQRYYDEIEEAPRCEAGVDTRELPDECFETAADPAELFEKLDQWGFRSIVIPHGNAWGLNTPPGTSFDKQLKGAQHDPDRQTLFEVYSGHGNSEELRAWSHVAADGSCPAPSNGFTPCCWRAGELIRERCEDPTSASCEARVREARQNHVDASVTGYWTVPQTRVEDWLDCGQCPDCFNAPFDHRPRAGAQYALALSSFEDPETPRRFRFGLIGSSDNHRARPGTGYKEFARHGMTEANGPPKKSALAERGGDEREAAARSEAYDPVNDPLSLQHLRHMERQASFFMTGGLVATHAAGRDRASIWDALERREVYATSGERILLWFDLLGEDGASVPMGSEATWSGTPRFRVRAAGAFEQKPGCPEHAIAGLGAEAIADLCLHECYRPSDRRRRISRVEVVRIRPQMTPGEDPVQLVEDPWRRLECPDDPAGCVVEFTDLEFAAGEREVVYYARAIQEPTPAVNAGGLRCKRDAEGRCIAVEPCHADYRTAWEDDCLAPNEERAWSSPIFLTPAGTGDAR